MKLNKIFIAGIAVMSIMAVSCSDDDDWSAGNPTNAKGLNVYIASNNNVVLPVDGNTFEVTYVRNITDGELTIPVKCSTSTPGIFTSIPTSVTFASGQAEATATFSCIPEMEMFKTYSATIVVDEQYTTQYADTTINLPRAELSIVKEDYKVAKKGTYLSWWTEEPEPAELQYSEILGSYRFNAQTSGEFTFVFKLGKANEDGTLPITYSDSFVNVGAATSPAWAHSTYGIMTMKGSKKKASYYDPATKTYWFDVNFTVSAGSFGNYYDTFTEE
jgi:hypothetical protein